MKRAASRPAADASPAASLHARALQAHRARDLDAAAALCDATLARDPDRVEALHLRALIDRDAGDLRGAMRRLKQAIALRADIAGYHLDLANILLALGRLSEAADEATTATSIAPAHLAGWYVLGNIRYACGDAAGAVAAYERAVACDPRHAQANNNLGTVLLQQGELSRAQQCFRQALESNPRYAIAANNLGTVHEASGDAAGAESWFAAAAALDPTYVEPLLNLSASLEKRGCWREAAAELPRVLALAPRNARAQWNLSLLRLRLGDLAAGWDGFDVGIGVTDYRGPARPHPMSPLDERAKRVLLWGEQGLGEQLLGLSMLGDLRARGIGGIVEVDPRLIDLCARSFPGFEFVAATLPADPRTLGRFDAALPLLSLGRGLRPDLAAFPRHAGYLAADPRRVSELRQRYAGGTTDRLVGISWCSGARRHAESKSTDIADWAPILRVPGLRFVSLQYGSDAEMLARARIRAGVEVIDDPEVDQLRDLDTYAAQVAAMDHVVTISNTTAHLAGALGRPTTVLLPRDRGLLWFWFTERPDSPWYPSLTLLRQTVAGRWDDVVAAAAARLAAGRVHP
ncbi:MAG: tetratricopeptide repeat protein [Alphaproteobacteria bacterium]|nr:tetratricopeptide repeat protein [Alphaproteobacteria bacterium]